MSNEYILETTDLTKEFKGFVAVNKVNLRVRRGHIHALIGPNGAGKTTCFNLLTKFLQPTSGTIVFDGVDITREAPAAIARRGVIRSFQISAVFQHLSVLENVRVALQRTLGTSFHFWKPESSLHKLDARAMELLAEVDLAAYAQLPAVELSYGRKRALEIATTLAMEPQLMLLDEPTQGMGIEDVDRIRQLIKKVSANRTILMVEHNMSVVSSHRRHHHRAAARRAAGRGAVRRGVEEPAGDRGLHGHHPDRARWSTLRWRRPSSKSRASTPGTANRTCCTASTCTSTKARSSRCWAATARAARRRCAPSWA
jgi:branched-chain amino acid transport system ATP-binding protein